MGPRAPYDFPDFAEKSIDIWNSKAEWWDDKIGDGNDFQIHLIEPSTHRLMDVQPDQEILDIACGAGRASRQMADRGASVLAIDRSTSFIKRAKERSAKYQDRIEYRVVDAADPDALLALGKARFDGAVCNMAMMDMASIDPLLSTLPGLLKPGGKFVFSVLHPAYNSSDHRVHAEGREAEGRHEVEHRVSVSRYAAPYPFLGVGVIGEPQPHYYFHRSISTLLNAGFKHGFVLDGMEEPILPEREDDPEYRFLGFSGMPDIPPILVARMRLIPE